MFTGIVETIGKIKSAAGGSLEITAGFDAVKLGDSVAVNGVCLTVSAMQGGDLSFDIMPVTLQDTVLGALRSGDTVNLERAMPADGRFGGHFVSGHIDETGVVEKINKDDTGFVLQIKISQENKRFLVPKGSIAINGVSLTIQSVQENSFTVSLVEHTRKITTLSGLQNGNKVNIEYDLLIRYLQNLLPAESRPTVLQKFMY